MRLLAAALALLAAPALAADVRHGNLPRAIPRDPAEVQAVKLDEVHAATALPAVKPVKLREHKAVQPRDVGKATAVPLDVDDDIHDGRTQVDEVKGPQR